MFSQSLSRAADRARWRSCPPSGPRATGRGLVSVLVAAVLAGCSTVPPAALLPTPDAAATPTTTGQATPTSTPTETATPAPLLPETDQVLARLAKVSRDGIGASGVAVLSDTGTTIAGRSATKPLAPASTLKVLTSLAALDTLGAAHTFTTKVVSGGKGRIVLVGGGDPLLTDKVSTSAAKPASLKALAGLTAAALADAGVKKVTLGYDDTLFTGPSFHPGWKKSWRSYLARVSPLVVGEGRFNPWQSDPHPAATAAKTFARRLEKAGIKVTRVRAREAPAGAATLASVESAPLEKIVARTLRLSDNLAAEVLARHVALASGQEPSFTGGAAAVRSWLVAHSLWDKGMKLVDGSGLSHRSRVTPAVLARALVTSLNTPTLAAVASGLPVAGRSGTLTDRFDNASERVARGKVHAKTGTLPGISGLAGYLTTRDGTRLVFAMVANDSRGQTTSYNWLDRSAAALVRCGCNR